MKYIIVILSLWCFTVQAESDNAQALTDSSTACRPSITFILGQDIESKSDQYYTLAAAYYRSEVSDENHSVIVNCKSILDLREHLYYSLPFYSDGWGVINIVAHGNPWTGLSAPINDEGMRTTINSLIESITSGELMPLPDYIIDEQTSINIKACGLGANQQWLEAFQLALGGFDEQLPKVTSSELFVQYAHDSNGKVQVKHLTPHYAFYKTAYRPANLHLERQLKSRYPDKNIAWLEAMKHDAPTIKGAAFHDRFNVPIEWYVAMDSPVNIDSLSSEESKIAFVEQQSDLLKIMNDYEIPIDKFRWTFSAEMKGEQNYILIKGKSTVLCVLQETLI